LLLPQTDILSVLSWGARLLDLPFQGDPDKT
jgi:hypothetical protein